MSEVNDFKEFLVDAGLAKFSDLLIEDGYDSVDVLREISDEEMVKFGFGGGHKKKLKLAIADYYEAAGSGHKAVSSKKKKSASETGKSAVVVAMVVGIGNYLDEAKRLEAPERDADMVCKTFKQYGIEVFTGEAILHPGKLELKEHLQNFYVWSKTKRPLTSIFYFSGHGCQFGDETHLITKEYPDDEDWLKEDASITLKNVRPRMFGKLKVVILDCCRARIGAKSTTPPITLKEQDVPKGELTVFACGPAHKAGGGHDPLSKFTFAFMESIGKKDCSVHRLFEDIRDEVIDNTQGKQKPEVFYNPEDGEAHGNEGCHVCLFPGLGAGRKGARGAEQDAATMGSDDDDDDDDRRIADQEAERRRLEEEAAERQRKEAERRRLEEEAAERQRKERQLTEDEKRRRNQAASTIQAFVRARKVWRVFEKGGLIALERKRQQKAARQLNRTMARQKSMTIDKRRKDRAATAIQAWYRGKVQTTGIQRQSGPRALPEGWIARSAGSHGGQVYYVNLLTGASTWEEPSLPAVKVMSIQEIRALLGPAADGVSLRVQLEEMARPRLAERIRQLPPEEREALSPQVKRKEDQMIEILKKKEEQEQIKNKCMRAVDTMIRNIDKGVPVPPNMRDVFADIGGQCVVPKCAAERPAHWAFDFTNEGMCQECQVRHISRRDHGLQCSNRGHWVCWRCLLKDVNWESLFKDQTLIDKINRNLVI